MQREPVVARPDVNPNASVNTNTNDVAAEPHSAPDDDLGSAIHGLRRPTTEPVLRRQSSANRARRFVPVERLAGCRAARLEQVPEGR